MGYEKSKIYKLQHEDGHFYIGSSTNELRIRLQQHKDKSKKNPDRCVYQHINNEWGKVRIILIELFVCLNRQELLKKEDEYIQKELDNPLCLNSKRAIRSRKEWYNDNCEDIKAHARQYYYNNCENAKANMKQYYSENKEILKARAKERYYKKKLTLPSCDAVLT